MMRFLAPIPTMIVLSYSLNRVRSSMVLLDGMMFSLSTQKKDPELSSAVDFAKHGAASYSI